MKAPKSDLPQENVHWDPKSINDLKEWLSPKTKVEMSSIFDTTPPGALDFKTKLEILASRIIGINYFVEIHFFE